MVQPDLVNEASIESAYQKSGNALGWRLLASPEETLKGADVAFVGLNPGGKVDDPSHPRFAVPGKSAYIDESWNGFPPGQSPLQKQVRKLFQMLRVVPEEVLSGNLVPFRSPTWNALPSKRSALDFGFELWRQILERAKPSLVVGMGGDATRQLARLLRADTSERIPLGWGKVTGTRAAHAQGYLVGLPHLSRFPVVGRQASEAGLRKLFGSSWHL
ncbi:MAG: uracil-DNA glycosylase family protein [Pseudomonadota bacterium]